MDALCKYDVLPQGLVFNSFNVEDNGKVTTDGYTVSKEMGGTVFKGRPAPSVYRLSQRPFSARRETGYRRILKHLY